MTPEIKVRILVEISRPWGTVTLDLHQTHPVVDAGPLQDEVDQALERDLKRIRAMYRRSRKAVGRG